MSNSEFQDIDAQLKALCHEAAGAEFDVSYIRKFVECRNEYLENCKASNTNPEALQKNKVVEIAFGHIDSSRECLAHFIFRSWDADDKSVSLSQIKNKLVKPNGDAIIKSDADLEKLTEGFKEFNKTHKKRLGELKTVRCKRLGHYDKASIFRHSEIYEPLPDLMDNELIELAIATIKLIYVLNEIWPGDNFRVVDLNLNQKCRLYWETILNL